MSREEIKKKIAEIDNAIFMNNMNDHWSDSDFERDRCLKSHKKELQEELMKLNEEDDLK